MTDEVEKISRRGELCMNVGKRKIMVRNNWEDSSVLITAEGTNVEVVEDFFYLGSYLSRTGSCDKECMIRIGKAAYVKGRQVNIWKSKNISLAVKIRRYESLVISTCCMVQNHGHYLSHKWKKLEAAHHKFRRRLLGITWRDKARNEDIRKKNGSRKLKDIIKERRLRWIGHVLRMENSRTVRQATQWALRGDKRKPGRPRKNWVDVIKREFKNTDLTWEEAEVLANDKAEWRRRVAQCSRLDAGWTKVR